MGRTERWIDLILGEEQRFSLQERIFNAVLFVSSLAGFFLFLGDIIQHLKPSIYWFSFSGWIVLMFMYYIARKTHQTKKLAIPYSIFLTIVFVYVWYNNGGIEGTALYYLFPMVVIVPLFIREKYSGIIFLAMVLIALALLIIEINNPDLILIIENDTVRKTDNFISAVMVTSTILFALILILHSYSKQHQKVIDLNRSKDKINSIIAHDLKNPLGTLNGLAKMLLERHNEMPADYREKIIDSIVKSSEETYNLLENLLQWARSESGSLKINKQKLNVSKQILDTTNLLSEGVRAKNQTIKTDIHKDIFIFADQNMLDTVFRNLLSNAIKFTPVGGEISIVIKRIDNGRISISFKDNGMGIDPRDIKRLFNKDIIHTTHGTNRERGTGLGLKLCNEFIQQNGGTIDLRSEVNVGTEFIVLFPEFA